MQVCQFSASSSVQFLRRRILNILCENLPFMSPRQPIKLSDLDKGHMPHGGLLNKHICEKKSNISRETAETVNFQFSHYKSVNYKLPKQLKFLSDQNKKHNFCRG